MNFKDDTEKTNEQKDTDIDRIPESGSTDRIILENIALRAELGKAIQRIKESSQPHYSDPNQQIMQDVVSTLVKIYVEKMMSEPPDTPHDIFNRIIEIKKLEKIIKG